MTAKVYYKIAKWLKIQTSTNTGRSSWVMSSQSLSQTESWSSPLDWGSNTLPPKAPAADTSQLKHNSRACYLFQTPQVATWRWCLTSWHLVYPKGYNNRSCIVTNYSMYIYIYIYIDYSILPDMSLVIFQSLRSELQKSPKLHRFLPHTCRIYHRARGDVGAIAQRNSFDLAVWWPQI